MNYCSLNYILLVNINWANWSKKQAHDKKLQLWFGEKNNNKTLLQSKIYSKRWLFPVFSFIFYNQFFTTNSSHKSKSLYTHRIHYKHKCLLYITVNMWQYKESVKFQTPRSKTCYSYTHYSNGNTKQYGDIMVDNTILPNAGVSQQQKMNTKREITHLTNFPMAVILTVVLLKETRVWREKKVSFDSLNQEL